MPAPKFSCPSCKENFTRYNHLFNHFLNIHYYTIRKCYEELFLLFGYNDIINLYCDKEYNITDFPCSIRLFIIEYLNLLNIHIRTHSEQKRTLKYSLKYKKTLMEKYGIDNVSKLDFVKNKKSQTHLKNYGCINNFCIKSISEKAKKNLLINLKNNKNSILIKYKKTLALRYGNNITNVSQLDHVKEAIRLSMINRINNGLQNAFRSKLEDTFENLVLRLLNIKYHCNKYVDHYNFDIVFDDFPVVIEINGDYWHCNPNKYLATDLIKFPSKKPILVENIWKRDKRKDDYIVSKGYKSIIIWESEILKNINNPFYFIEKILKIIYGDVLSETSNVKSEFYKEN